MSVGACECGCGMKTNLAPQNNSLAGWKRGQPMRFILGHNGRKSDLYRVDPKTGCWLWLLGKRGGGYGMKWSKGRHVMAHRFIYEKMKGPIPKGKVLDHLCRVPSCVNPSHLEPVSFSENIRRGRSVRISMKIANQIRMVRRTCGLSYNRLAAAFGTSKKNVLLIVQGKAWKQ